MSFSTVHKGPKSVDFDKSEAPEDGIKADREVQKVEGEETQAVNIEGCRVHVVMPQLCPVRLQHSILQVAGSEVNANVYQVHKVGRVVQAEPNYQGFWRDFLGIALLANDPFDTSFLSVLSESVKLFFGK